MKYSLTEKQVAVLREIAAATDAVAVQPRDTQTAWALEQRGLIKRAWRGSRHVSVVTADGRSFLKDGKHPGEARAEKERMEGDAERAGFAPVDGAALISRLRASSGKVTVADPGPQTRGRWRAAYYDALHHGHIPDGHKLRWSGRQRGDSIFILVDEETEKAAQPQPIPVIDVPVVLKRPHPLVRATRKALGRSRTTVDTRDQPEVIPLYLSRPLVDRALRIMHALLTEAENRGYQVETQTELRHGEATHSVAIVIRGTAFPLAVTERTTRVPHESTPEEIRRQERSPWTQVSKYDEKWNGQLSVGAPTGSLYQRSYSYRDSPRWTLESRLGHLLRDFEHFVAEAERLQQEKELREAERQRQQFAVLAQARKQQVEEHRSEVLLTQVQAWRRASDIRSFCSALRERAGASTPSAGELQWLQWAEEYAAKIDPLSSSLSPPPDPPADRESLRRFLEGNLNVGPWPFNTQGHWTGPDEGESDRRV